MKIKNKLTVFGYKLPQPLIKNFMQFEEFGDYVTINWITLFFFIDAFSIACGIQEIGKIIIYAFRIS